LTVEQNDLTMRPIAGREELSLFSRLPYVLNDELADDLAVGRRRPECGSLFAATSCWPGSLGGVGPKGTPRSSWTFST
jgi:hypothetical protein